MVSGRLYASHEPGVLKPWGVTVARKRFLLVPVCCDALSVFPSGGWLGGGVNHVEFGPQDQHSRLT